MRPSVVQIVSDSGFGSGFIIGSDLIATCHHCVAGQRTVVVYFANGTSATCDAYAAANAQKDIVILRVRTDRRAEHLHLSSDLPPAGEPVVSVRTLREKAVSSAELSKTTRR